METKELELESPTKGDHVVIQQNELGAALAHVADVATKDDQILRILAIADGIASGIQTEGINAAELGQLMLLLRENVVARDMFIEKCSHIQGNVDLTNVKGFNNIMAHVLWNPALGPKMEAMHALVGKKTKQSIGSKRVGNWIKAFENVQNDEKAKTTTVTDVLAALLYKEECIEALTFTSVVLNRTNPNGPLETISMGGPQSVLKALCSVYDADRVQKWAEKAHDKAKKAGYIPSDVEPEQTPKA